MYELYQHVEDGKQLYLGEYESLPACQRATEVMWDVLEQRGYTRATFHCERAGSNEPSVGWVYGVR